MNILKFHKSEKNDTRVFIPLTEVLFMNEVILKLSSILPVVTRRQHFSRSHYRISSK